jgi:hypothetical protein
LRWTLLAARFAALALTMAAQDLPPEVVQLAHMKQKTAASLKSLPDYTCQVTTTRYHSDSAKAALKRVDTLRLEVAHVDGRELYSWPGEAKFNDQPVTQMIHSGMIGDGDFAGHLRSLFVHDVGIERFAGTEAVDGRRQLHWTFFIPRLQSQWMISEANQSALAGAEGSFWADAESLELLRLEIRTRDLPPRFPIASAESRIDYARVHIGARDVLLPQTAQLTLVQISGGSSRNVTEFSGCRQFTGDSTISFAEPEPASEADGATAPPVQQLELPAGLLVTTRLSNAIDLNHAAIGDTVEASLIAALHKGRQEFAPKGARVLGRIVQLEKVAATQAYFVSLEFTEIRYPGHSAAFSGSLRTIDSLAPRRQWRLADRGPGVYLQNIGARLERGTLMTWVTAKPR